MTARILLLLLLTQRSLNVDTAAVIMLFAVASLDSNPLSAAGGEDCLLDLQLPGSPRKSCLKVYRIGYLDELAALQIDVQYEAARERIGTLQQHGVRISVA